MSFPELQSNRLKLRSLEDKDLTALYGLRSNEQVNRYLDRAPARSVEDAQAFIRKIRDGIAGNQSFYWAITLKEQPGLIGTICIWNLSVDRKTAELGYELHPDNQGKGYMQEAIALVIRFAFDRIGLSVLEAHTHKDNSASTKLLLKNGFQLEAGKKDPDNKNNLIYLLRD
jgi:ribosomal-protein-alanine N-acetyltransferase